MTSIEIKSVEIADDKQTDDDSVKKFEKASITQTPNPKQPKKNTEDKVSPTNSDISSSSGHSSQSSDQTTSTITSEDSLESSDDKTTKGASQNPSIASVYDKIFSPSTASNNNSNNKKFQPCTSISQPYLFSPHPIRPPNAASRLERIVKREQPIPMRYDCIPCINGNVILKPCDHSSNNNPATVKLPLQLQQSQQSNQQLQNYQLNELTKLAIPYNWPVVRLSNIPWDVSSKDIKTFFSAFNLPDASTGKTYSEAFIELVNKNEAKRAVETRNLKPLKGRIITCMESTQGDLMKAIFPKWKGEFSGSNAIVTQTVLQSNPTIPHVPFITREEMNSLLKSFFKLHFSRKCAERPFENIISVLVKFPFHQGELYTTLQRDLLFEMLKLAIESLKIHLSKEYHRIDDTLMERMMRAGILTPVFTERQKLMVLHVSGLSLPEDLQGCMPPFKKEDELDHSPMPSSMQNPLAFSTHRPLNPSSQHYFKLSPYPLKQAQYPTSFVSPIQPQKPSLKPTQYPLQPSPHHLPPSVTAVHHRSFDAFNECDPPTNEQRNIESERRIKKIFEENREINMPNLRYFDQGNNNPFFVDNSKKNND
ncbi:2907_t:CDS:10 [Entrophospora sp. SA101]|nr:2907_t:CDS:10 [Entrophospora sp. SA101]